MPLASPSSSRPTASLPRRGLIRGAAWSVPAIAIAAAAPAAAVSSDRNVPDGKKGPYGLYVSAAATMGGTGYAGGNNNGGAYTQPEPTSDALWSDARGYPVGSYYTNGEGDFTPYSNSRSGTQNTYASTSGFWWQAPRDANGEFIKRSTATLVKGATFVTKVTAVFPDTWEPNDPATTHFTNWNGLWITDQRTIWADDKGREGTSNTQALGAPTHPVAFDNTPHTWTATPLTYTKQPDGSWLVEGTITATTTRDSKIEVTAQGGRTYGQARFMPSNILIQTNNGWLGFKLTSWVQNATLTYTVPAGAGPAPAPRTITNDLTQTTFIRPARSQDYWGDRRP
ncbi:hypothetical protein [Actinomyces faecalis]|uniref:hypothetical protein n=1 Tax=Actinomyces faecalis TaxID=2722820 RepID=UPI001557DB47|nr:hypothetical protein [Actinomyces faecalis]